ncbi:Ecto-ADP-ribosyltransferase 3 [Cricetulus griseus]|uniref:NAD(P)(+)--arginine ADP-ribosyltransferase n=1 Tax=Cricetulus griseus TaxID=10029 RepID=G3ID19_CRIGR|nr:Ecto-ADP-ribosyltransferase 3 [Cricetulus griseus]
MEMKYIQQLFKEESASHRLLETVWDNAGILWDARKAQIPVPLTFKNSYGIALMAFVTEAREQTPFYHTFNRAVKMAGHSRKSYIYDFPFKAFHFYLTRALHLLRRPCGDSYKDVVYLTSPGISFNFGEKNLARLGNFTLAYSAKPPIDNNQPVLTIHTCFGVPVERFFGNESERVVLIPLSEVFHVSQEGTDKGLTLHSINKTCSYYDCAFLGGRKRLESTGIPGGGYLVPQSDMTVFSLTALGPVPVPGPKSHPSASSGRMLLPPVTASIALIVTSAVSISTAL